MFKCLFVSSFISDECKRTDFIGSFIRDVQLKMEKSHAIYRALVVADEVNNIKYLVT